MTVDAPLIDARTSALVLRQILGDPAQALPGLRDFYTPQWTGRTADDPGYTVAFLFSKLMEVLLDRLNQAPEKNFIAFLDLLGIDRLPGNPARTPVKFFLPDGNRVGGTVLSETQVATGPMPSGTTYVFETEKTLFVTPVHLQKVLALVPSADVFQDASSAIDATVPAGIDLASPASATPIEHSLYIAHATLLGFDGPAELVVDVGIAPSATSFLPSTAAWNVTWERYFVDNKGQASWQQIVPASGSELVARLLASGQIVFRDFSGASDASVGNATQGGGLAPFIRARLTTPLVPAVFVGDPSVLPRLDSLNLGLTIRRSQLQLDAAFNNSLPLDLSRDFAPLGAQPKISDTFYFQSNEAFSQPGAIITLRAEISQGVTVIPSSDLELRWEVWNSREWQSVVPTDGSVNFSVGATASPPAGEIQFTIPTTVAPTTVNGVTGYWGRVRIVQGNYGNPAHYQAKPGSSPVEFVFVPESLHPPMLSRLTLDYQLIYSPDLPEKALTLNSFEFVDRRPALATPGSGFPPFDPGAEPSSSLYIGADDVFGDHEINLFIQIQDKPGNTTASTQAPQVIWEYSAADGTWSRLELSEDGTNQLTASGVISFFGPQDSALRERFGQVLFWIRARLLTAPSGHLVSGVFLNTVNALNQTTVKDEVLGSGNGTSGQTMPFSQHPVLTGEQIYVREQERPPDDAVAILEQTEVLRLGRPLTSSEKDEFVVTRTNVATGESETWVRWQQVKNFLSSGPQSRHYVLDRVAGTLTFGDGRSGMLPPIGRDNIQAFQYQAGGGLAASKEVTAGSVKQLRSPLPFVSAVANLLDAGGGSDPETRDNVLERGPQTIKNRDRAVTTEDYVWLAKQASTLVNRAKCLATRNDRLEFEPGSVTVLVVPQTSDLRPTPSQDLLRIVRDYLLARSLPAISVYALAPQYHEVRVTAQVVPLNPAEATIVEGRLSAALDLYLNPVNGGPKGTGWDFGRTVPISEIFKVMEDVPGVDLVLSAELNEDASMLEVDIGENELPVPGTHSITMLAVGE